MRPSLGGPVFDDTLLDEPPHAVRGRTYSPHQCRALVAMTCTVAVLLLLCQGCIKRDAPAAGANAAESDGAAAGSYAPKEPTGMYGKVPGEDVLGGDITAFQPHGKTELVELSTIAVEGQPFGKAIRANIKGVSGNTWDVQIQAKNEQRVERGDVLLATFHFRTEWTPQESGEGQTEFVFELARDPWTKSTSYPVRAGREWKKVSVPFVSEGTYEPGQAQMIFRLGYSAETIEIGGVKVENFKKQLALADLPVTKLSYRGSEPDAAWREAAQQRIEKHRKADLSVAVQDAQGNPVRAASVNIELARHEFAFGTAVVANKLTNPGNDQYKQALVESFNYATLENNLKWVALQGDWGPSFTLEGAKSAVTWLKERGIPTRGHVLIWPGWRNLPRSLKQLETQPDQLRANWSAR